MSEQKRLQTFNTYDFTKIITGISCSTVYIPAIQKILSNWILAEDKIETVGDTFKKFVAIQELDQKLKDLPQEEQVKAAKDGPKLDEWEQDVYCLWSLVQQMKYLAKEQGLEIETKTDATEEDIAALGTMLAKGQDINSKLSELSSKLKIVK